MKTYMTVHTIVMKDGKILVLQRAKTRTNPGTWNTVTGHVQDKESAEDAALRELKEETNLKGRIIKTAEPFWVDQGDVRWIVVPSLVDITDVSQFKMDEGESQAFRWIGLDDQIVKDGLGLKKDLQLLGLI